MIPCGTGPRNRHPMGEPWSNEEAYELRVGRWSRLAAMDFLAWLGIGPGLRWLDVGAGTGALAAAIAARCSPAVLVAFDRALADLRYGRARRLDGGARRVVGDARALPLRAGSFDAVVAGLSLNFLPDAAPAIRAMGRLVTPRGGVVAAYVWDFGGEMQPHRRFWDAAIALDPAAARYDQANKFPLCRLGALEAAFVAAGLRDVAARTVDVWAVFHDFEDLWRPFVIGDGSVVEYTRSLSEERLQALRDRVRGSVEVESDGTIRLLARAFAVRAYV